jgi:hypothetical protein
MDPDMSIMSTSPAKPTLPLWVLKKSTEEIDHRWITVYACVFLEEFVEVFTWGV